MYIPIRAIGFALLCWIPLLVLVCCSPIVDRTELLKGIPLDTLRIHPVNTDISPATVTAPVGYTVSMLTDQRNVSDIFLIFPAADTVGQSSRPFDTAGTLPKAQLMLQFTASRAPLETEGLDVLESQGLLNNEPIVWRSTTNHETGSTTYVRESVSKAPLQQFNAQRDDPIYLWLIVSGTDSMEVERLMTTAETLQFLPAEPNL